MSKYDMNLASPLTIADLDKLLDAWEEATKVRREFHPDKDVFYQTCERSKGYIYSVGLLFSGSIGTAKEADLICEVLNNLPQLIAAAKAVAVDNAAKADPKAD